MDYRFPSKVAKKTAEVVGVARPDLVKTATLRAAKVVRGIRAKNGVKGRKHGKKTVKVAKATRRSRK